MKTIQLADMNVQRLGFGAMRVCGANVWGPHVDEELIAEALHPYPKGLVIATKGGLLRPRPSAWDPDGRPEHLKRAIDGSLSRLKLERIDLYQLHAPDPAVPFEDSVRTLADAQRAGKIRHVGLSNVSVKQLESALKICPIVSVQNRYNLEDRSSENVLKACEKRGIAFLPWYPLGAGSSLKTSGVKKIATKLKATPAQVALAWLLAKSPVMLPIPGTASIPHLEDNVAAAAVQLSTEDLASLD